MSEQREQPDSASVDAANPGAVPSPPTTDSEDPRKPDPDSTKPTGPAPSYPKPGKPGNETAQDEEDQESEEDAEESETEEPSDAQATAELAPIERAPDSTPLISGDALWGSIARSVALSGVIGFALASWAELAFAGRSANDLLARNAFELGERVSLIKDCLGAAVLSAIGAACGAFVVRRKGLSAGVIERWLWFLSPLMLAPGLAATLHYRPWVNEHARLLPVVLVLAIAFEVLAFQALRAAPRAARQWWQEAVEQIPPLARKHGPLAIVVAASVGYAVFFSFYLLRWHYKLKTGNFDLSINNNLMFGGLHGHFLESPVVFPQDPKKYLANHAKFGGYLFLPIYALYPKPQTLLVLQSTLIGLSGLPLYGFARRHLSEWLAALVALAYLSYYPMHGASFSEFQYVPIAGFFVLTAIWAAEERRWVIFGIVLAMGITMREDIPIGMATVGAFLLLSGYRPLPGLLMTIVSAIYFVVLRFYVMDAAGDWWFPSMYKELWSEGERGFGSVIKTLLSNPLFVISKVLVEKKVIYLLHLLVPLAFLPARRWYLWAAFIPGVLLTLLVTNYDPPITFSFHYVMHWAPYLFAAAVLALEAIGKRPDFGFQRQHAAALAFFGASAVLSYNYGAFWQRNGTFRGGFQRVDFTVEEGEVERHDNLYRLIAKLPPDASVAATEKIGPHVSSRLKMYTMRHGPQDADYVLASSRELKLSRTRPKLLEALRSGKYGVVERIADLALLKKGQDTSQNELMIRDWRLVDRPPPANEPPAPRTEPPEPKAPEDDPAAAEPRAPE